MDSCYVARRFHCEPPAFLGSLGKRREGGGCATAARAAPRPVPPSCAELTACEPRGIKSGIGALMSQVFNSWQPISSAPRDGTRLLLVEDGVRLVGAWLPEHLWQPEGW